MRKIIELGKIDYLGNGRKSCAVEIAIELRDTDKGPELSICGDIWNHKHTDIYCGGQCLDTIAKYIDTPEFREIHRLWRNYHLNGMHAGTVEQEEAIDKYLAETNKRYDYKEVCNYLESIGLLTDGEYRYGTGWLYRSIPEKDLNKIRDLIKNQVY